MTNYRDELIQTIKDMGQELIDRAESMVHENCDMITNFNINIDIPQPVDGSPELTWSTSVINKTFYNRMGRAAGDMKLEVHAETATVEKKDVYIEDNHKDKTITAVFPTRREAESCLCKLDDAVRVYGAVSVADLYYICGVIHSQHEESYGWTNVTTVSVKRDERGHCICLPYPMPLD